MRRNEFRCPECGVRFVDQAKWFRHVMQCQARSTEYTIEDVRRTKMPTPRALLPEIQPKKSARTVSVAALEATVADLTRQNSDLRRQINTEVRRFQNSTQNELESQIAELTRTNASLNARLEVAENGVQNTTATNERLKNQVSELQDKLCREINALQEQSRFAIQTLTATHKNEQSTAERTWQGLLDNARREAAAALLDAEQRAQDWIAREAEAARRREADVTQRLQTALNEAESRLKLEAVETMRAKSFLQEQLELAQVELKGERAECVRLRDELTVARGDSLVRDGQVVAKYEAELSGLRTACSAFEVRDKETTAAIKTLEAERQSLKQAHADATMQIERMRQEHLQYVRDTEVAMEQRAFEVAAGLRAEYEDGLNAQKAANARLQRKLADVADQVAAAVEIGKERDRVISKCNEQVLKIQLLEEIIKENAEQVNVLRVKLADSESRLEKATALVKKYADDLAQLPRTGDTKVQTAEKDQRALVEKYARRISELQVQLKVATDRVVKLEGDVARSDATTKVDGGEL